MTFPPGIIRAVFGTRKLNSNKLITDSTVQKYVGPEPTLGVSRENIRRKIKSWIDNQHMAMWWGLISTQTHAQKLIWGTSLTAKTRLLSLNKTQSKSCYWHAYWT
jgi:hypothetical protein